MNLKASDDWKETAEGWIHLFDRLFLYSGIVRDRVTINRHTPHLEILDKHFADHGLRNETLTDHNSFLEHLAFSYLSVALRHQNASASIAFNFDTNTCKTSQQEPEFSFQACWPM